MDIVQVRELAAMVGTKATELDQIAQQITGKLSSTSWLGPDATQFRADWDSIGIPSLKKVAELLRAVQAAATSNAAQQESASAK